MNELRNIVLCAERLRTAETEEEFAEARSDLAAIEAASVTGAVCVWALRLYVTKPAVVCLAIAMVSYFCYYTVKNLLR